MADKSSKIVIIGAVACGPKAAARARRRDPRADITVIDKGKFISYAGCGLPYFIAGAVPELKGLMTTSSGALRDKNFFDKIKGIKILLGTEVLEIDRNKKEVKVKNIESGSVESLPYDKLVIAAGAVPVIPKIEGIGLKKIFTLRKPEDAQSIRVAIEGGEADKICIIGAGRIGLEAADAFGAQGVDAAIVELAAQVLPSVLDLEIADYAAKVLRDQKVNLILGEKVIRFEGDSDGCVKKVITDKREIETDAVLLGVGVKPDTGLAKAAGLEIGVTGAISVDEYLRTSDPDIYAGGDCVECTNAVTGKKTYNPLGSVANRHGRVIGTNITGGDEIFPGVLSSSVIKTLGISVAKTGLSEAEARELGYRVVSSLNPSGDRSHFFPGGKYVVLKLIADANTRKVLGAQAVGGGDIVRQIDSIATAITFGATVDRLANVDFCYAPPFSMAISNVAHSANIIRNKLDGLVVSVSPAELKAKINRGDDFILLDVRSAKEVEKDPVKAKKAVWIPQDELKSRASELPPDTEIVVGCQIGLRAYDSLRAVLKSTECKNLKILDGGWHVWFNCGYDE